MTGCFDWRKKRFNRGDAEDAERKKIFSFSAFSASPRSIRFLIWIGAIVENIEQ
jgi:hypothetical protein